MNIENVEFATVNLMPGVLPPEEEEERPSSFPIDPIPDDTKSDEDVPVSFPIVDPVTDDTKQEEDRPLSFPIDPIPDDTGVKG